MTIRPKVLIVDDEDQRLVVHELEQNGLTAVWRFPTAVTLDDLCDATLVAVDQYIQYESAPDEDLLLPLDVPEALVPYDGLALAAVFRSAAKRAGRTKPLPIALRSGDLDRLTQGRPRAIRETILSATHDLEWVLSKTDPDDNPGNRTTAGNLGGRTLTALARALIDFPSSGGRPSLQEYAGWLLPKNSPSWAVRAARQIEQCRPPTNAALEESHGLSWLRWLAHQCLPFPTFVTNDIRTATELGISVDSFREILSAESLIGDRLRNACYDGPLAGLHPRRFWRAAIRELVSELVDTDELDDPQVIGEHLAKMDSRAQPLDLVDPVVCIDPNYYDLEQPVEQREAHRLTPDYWPAYADPPFAHVDALAQDPDLQALLAPRLQA
ncbi:Uncharacterised protein [Mycobacteroides abscessus subsp. bolletii]|uniref:hypothetical protein n=1 Tax=Mycobacteroides abscessus TaxID=36809 RepID=UPI0009287482|nr:hypothetical protein [Mycobacteroides abscessus]SHR16501.1 Uncharacterised protein [Mycobacteroides abscessus subsp. bolletii]SHS76237.1 Uncharacterised protein [Mycobacteroides abscessus subsp. bolletii]SHS89126.1 Uncharacterised protein [Mycobacteroides abscessus subsp. bolletii]SHT55093.1 Uncharacterised protein [Mycobacteroides abscessus subsp. bolletii]SHY48280.1 Uncharacterised protein [Mycobacteroides abscessus subsp. bolletii]